MPGELARFVTATYHSARDLPEAVWDAFRSHPRDSNVVYFYAVKALAKEPTLQRDTWITCSSNDTHPPSLEFVLSCTVGPHGSYPIFIFTTLPEKEHSVRNLSPRISRLVDALRAAVPLERVFSVFAPVAVTTAFTHLWSEATYVENYIASPYYAATFTYCTKQTFTGLARATPSDIICDLRKADRDDIPEVARLCYGFAIESPPFVLSKEGALAEATHLVRNQQVWLHRIQSRSGERPAEVASIVAVTRETEEVAAITKVYTSPNWRGYGCAGRLVRHVTKQLLEAKQSVVLYVAHDNGPAASVYRRIGFVGLGGDEHSTHVDGVSDWLEVGFDRQVVQLGHW